MMNYDFKRFLSLADQERKDVFSATASRLDTEPIYIEKDFWVCHILDAIYNGLPEHHPQILFKGGTSLSKAFNLIQRFSEDIDIIICRNGLGFDAERDPTHPGQISKNKRKSLFKELEQCCGSYIKDNLRIALQSLLGSQCQFNQDADPQTLLVRYHSLYPIDALPYVFPQVKLEAGARSALAPNTTANITTYIAEILDSGWSFEVGNLRVIDPTRTCLEKILILHAWHCGYRDSKRLPTKNERVSRHYYDVAMIMATETGHNAIANRELLDDVRQHNMIAFRQKWKKYEEAIPGSIHLVPQAELHTAIERDYAAMQDMIFGKAPSFDWIVGQLQHAEDLINLPSSP